MTAISDPEVRINTQPDIASMSDEVSIPKAPKTDRDKIDIIIETVSSFTNVSKELMEGMCRKREYVTARSLCMYFIYENKLKPSLKSTGELFGNRDHSTVIHAIETVEDLCDSNRKFREQFILLKHKIEIQIL